MPALTITQESTVTEDQIDHLGHMNVRFYGTNAQRGTRTVVDGLDVDRDTTLSLDDVYTRHHQEQLLGASLVVRSGIIAATPAEIRIYHELANVDDGVLAATFVHGLTARNAAGAAVTLPDAVVEQAGNALVETPTHGATRSIDLTADPIRHAPTLDVARERGLEMREPRPVGDDECDADGRYIPEFAPMLTWGGVPTGGGGRGDRLHDGPNGEKMGWASMETRMFVCRLPTLGENIHAFGALIELRDKTTQRVQWAFSLDHGDLLTSFETVSLAFDTVGRRPMSIPPHIRAGELSTLHADLAPRASA